MTDPEIPTTPPSAPDAFSLDYSNDNCCMILCAGQPIGMANRVLAWDAVQSWEANVYYDTPLGRGRLSGQGATPKAAVENAFLLFMAGVRAVREMRTLMGLLPPPARIRADAEAMLEKYGKVIKRGSPGGPTETGVAPADPPVAP